MCMLWCLLAYLHCAWPGTCLCTVSSSCQTRYNWPAAPVWSSPWLYTPHAWKESRLICGFTVYYYQCLRPEGYTYTDSAFFFSFSFLAVNSHRCKDQHYAYGFGCDKCMPGLYRRTDIVELVERCSEAISELLWCIGNTSVTSDRSTRFKPWRECLASQRFINQSHEVL